MRYFALVALAAWTASAGCNADCAQSPDIQVMISPNPDVVLGEVTRLHVMLSVADGPTRALDITPTKTLPADGSAFLLHPDPAPADRYDVSLTVQAFAGTTLVAIGSESMVVSTAGCN